MSDNVGSRWNDPRVFETEAEYVAWLQSGITDEERDRATEFRAENDRALEEEARDIF